MSTLWIAGWGFRATAQQASFADCWEQACAQLSDASFISSPPASLSFALLQSRADTSAWQALLAWQSIYLPHVSHVQYTESDIQQVGTQHQSERLLRRFGTGSVCEALALCAALKIADSNPIYRALPRIVSADRRATLAIVQLIESNADQALPLSQSLQSGVPS